MKIDFFISTMHIIYRMYNCSMSINFWMTRIRILDCRLLFFWKPWIRIMSVILKSRTSKTSSYVIIKSLFVVEEMTSKWRHYAVFLTSSRHKKRCLFTSFLHWPSPMYMYYNYNSFVYINSVLKTYLMNLQTSFSGRGRGGGLYAIFFIKLLCLF